MSIPLEVCLPFYLYIQLISYCSHLLNSYYVSGTLLNSGDTKTNDSQFLPLNSESRVSFRFLPRFLTTTSTTGFCQDSSNTQLWVLLHCNRIWFFVYICYIYHARRHDFFFFFFFFYFITFKKNNGFIKFQQLSKIYFSKSVFANFLDWKINPLNS